MSSWRRVAKGIVESVAGSGVAVRTGLARRNGSRLILAYHNVVASDTPPSLGDRSLHLPLGRFLDQLDAIEALRLRVVPLGSPAAERPSKDPEIVLTFDDAYAGTLLHGVPELASRGLPATVFVAPGLLGSPAPWWDLLADPRLGSVPEPIRNEALISLAGNEAQILARAVDQGWAMSAAQQEHRIGTESELHRAMELHSGLTLGTHTWSHPNLAALAEFDEPATSHQLTESSRWLAERFGQRVVPYLAYPYGLQSPAARRIAAAAGLAGALCVSGGWDNQHSDRFSIARLNVTPGMSRDGFRARLAGFLS